ncbi:hypothetical protein Pd630_LPD16175 (plasmid) [Rhodococcus opacus PD630]|nr:hypothetical protein Pd630_LPD16175 [Rhodococcus opacus PD630]
MRGGIVGCLQDNGAPYVCRTCPQVSEFDPTRCFVCARCRFRSHTI